VDRISETVVVVDRPQVLEHDRLQRRTVRFLGRVERASRPERPEGAGIEEEELRMSGELPFSVPREVRDPHRDEEILESREVSLDGSSLDRAVAGEAGHIQDRRL
jgi:hypothetical protein